MKRDYKGIEQGVLSPAFFIGNEVEKTKAFGRKTLFCRGDIPLWKILKELPKHEGIEHVYLNHNHTKLSDRENKIVILSEGGYLVTEEVPYEKNVLGNNPYKVFNDNHIILVSIPVAYAESQNLYLKIDDYGFKNFNSGVWTFHVSDLDECKTEWDAYKDDEIVMAGPHPEFDDGVFDEKI